MTRPAIPDFVGPYPQYYSIMTLANGTTVLGQVKSVEASDKVDTTKAARVGSSTKKTLRKSKESTVKVSLWIDYSDMDELARVLGATSTPTTGTTVKLDTSVAAQTFLVKTYDGESIASTLLSTRYLYAFVPTELSYKLDSEGEQVADISGDTQDLYDIKA